ncbi:hypothetical protein H2248_008112 [Termitomyces sp. 'cryptogamus']|nr:hypothetical protein H2248_008112 [Termitomyces sp. 'cryptogamus']
MHFMTETCECFGSYAHTGSVVIDPHIACTPPLSRHDANRSSFFTQMIKFVARLIIAWLRTTGLANAWIGMLMFDALIFSITVYKSWKRGYMVRRSLFKVLLRDGAIYFGIMVAIALVTVITFHDYQRGSTATLANIVSSTMINRLMLNIRDPKFSLRLTHPTHLSVLEFNATSNAEDVSHDPWNKNSYVYKTDIDLPI